MKTNKPSVNVRRIVFDCDQEMYEAIQKNAKIGEQSVSAWVRSTLRLVLGTRNPHEVMKTHPAIKTYTADEHGTIITEIKPPPTPPTREENIAKIKEMMERGQARQKAEAAAEKGHDKK